MFRGVILFQPPKQMENLHKASAQPLPMLVNPVTGTSIGVAYNQQNIGTTIRPASTALLTIDSEDRFNNYEEKRTSYYPNYNWSPYDFTITKTESLMNGFFTRLAVTEVVFPTTALPNISETTQDIIVRYLPSGGSATNAKITLDIAFYKPHDLATELQSKIRAINTALNATTVEYGLDATGNPSAQFIYATNNTTQIAFLPLPYNSAQYPYPNTTRQLFDLLGFGTENESLNVTGYSGTTNCQGTAFVDIVCSQLCYNQALKDTSSQTIVRDALCRLYLIPDSYNNMLEPNDPDYAPPGTIPQIIYRNFSAPKQIAWTPNQPVGQLSFQVYDDNGALLTPYLSVLVQNNIEWSMTLQVSEN
jgi:hypothetical protein